MDIDIRPFVKRINAKILSAEKSPIAEVNHVLNKGKHYKVVVYEVPANTIGTAFYKAFPLVAEITYEKGTLLKLEKSVDQDRILFGFYIPELYEQE